MTESNKKYWKIISSNGAMFTVVTCDINNEEEMYYRLTKTPKITFELVLCGARMYGMESRFEHKTITLKTDRIDGFELLVDKYGESTLGVLESDHTYALL